MGGCLGGRPKVLLVVGVFLRVLRCCLRVFGSLAWRLLHAGTVVTGLASPAPRRFGSGVYSIGPFSFLPSLAWCGWVLWDKTRKSRPSRWRLGLAHVILPSRLAATLDVAFLGRFALGRGSVLASGTAAFFCPPCGVTAFSLHFCCFLC